MKYAFPTLLFMITLASYGQSANTLTLNSGKSPASTLKDIEWLTGHWRGEAFGGITEEVWTPALGGSMMCAFKLVSEGKVSFYELVAITEEGGTLMLRLKHFHGNMKGWEEKDKTIDFPLVKVEANRVYFDGMTFERAGADQLNVYVVIRDRGQDKEVKFPYTRLGK